MKPITGEINKEIVQVRLHEEESKISPFFLTPVIIRLHDYCIVV